MPGGVVRVLVEGVCRGKLESIENIVLEKYTGKTTKRPKLEELIEKLQEGDTLVVTKLDRLSRSVHDGIELVNKLTEKGIKVNILNT